MAGGRGRVHRHALDEYAAERARWGSAEIRLGNNPIVLAVPRPPAHVVFDMAMSQFSYGALGAYRERGEQLPVDGGFDSEGRLTRDPAAIEESQRVLPVGYWKGAGLAMMLDMIAAILSGGPATHQIPIEPEREIGVPQFFLRSGSGWTAERRDGDGGSNRGAGRIALSRRADLRTSGVVAPHSVVMKRERLLPGVRSAGAPTTSLRAYSRARAASRD
jgi:LDH2 family malate/lactate/ureidoglycolate dehydrogenase